MDKAQHFDYKPEPVETTRLDRLTLKEYRGEGNILRNGVLNGFQFRGQLSVIGEFPELSSSTEALRESDSRLIMLPGVSLPQAEAFLIGAQKTVDGLHKLQLDYRPLATFATMAMKRVRPESQPHFGNEFNRSNEFKTELQVGYNGGNTKDGSAQKNVAQALTQNRVLRFSYPDSSGELSVRRVKVRSIYAKRGVPEFFRAESFGRIRTYSVAKVQNVFKEATSAKYILPLVGVHFELNTDQSTPMLKLVRLV
jgi:hypothetical protein